MSDRLQMFGPVYGRHLICDYFERTFPTVLADLRVEWGLDEDSLPTPAKWVPHEPDAVDVYPMIAVATGLVGTSRRIEITPTGAAYRTTLPFEVYAWTLGTGRVEAQDLRDWMSAAVKVCVLGAQTFGTRGQTVDVSVDEETFEQSWSDVQKTRGGDRFAAGSLTSFDLRLTEHLGPYGATLSPRVDTVAVDAASSGSPFASQPTPLALPVHPAFE